MRKNRTLRAALGLGAAMSLWMGLYAYGAQSSVIESVSVSFKTIYGEPEEIPEPEVTVSGKAAPLGMCSTARIMTTGNRGARSGWRSRWWQRTENTFPQP